VNSGGLHHGTESLIKVHARALGEPPEDPTCLVPVKRTVSLKLMLEDLLASDDVGPWRPWYQVPCPIGQQGLVLLFHSAPPVGVDEHTMDRGGDGGQHRRGCGGELQAIHELGDPVNTTRDHRVREAGAMNLPEWGPPATSGRLVEAQRSMKSCLTRARVLVPEWRPADIAGRPAGVRRSTQAGSQLGRRVARAGALGPRVAWVRVPGPREVRLRVLRCLKQEKRVGPRSVRLWDSARTGCPSRLEGGCQEKRRGRRTHRK
jgi:hypothetical protein